MHLIDDLAPQNLGDDKVGEVTPVAFWFKRGVDVDDGRSFPKDAGGEFDRAREHAQQGTDFTLRRTLAADLKLAQSEGRCERRAEQLVQMCRYTADRCTCRTQE